MRKTPEIDIVEDEEEDDDDSPLGGFEPTEIEIPRFLKNKNF